MIEERESGRNVVRLLDPIRGAGAVLFEKPAGAGEVAPAPDTERYAYFLPAQPGAAQNVIRVVTSNGTVEREIVAMGATRLGSSITPPPVTGFSRAITRPILARGCCTSR